METKEAFKFSGEDAENYDHYLGPLLFEPYARYLASEIDQTNIESVLELACGTGRVTRHIRTKLSDDIKLLATDISSDMLHIAKRKLGNEDITFGVEDAQNLSFADNSFDLVIFQFGIMFLPDKREGLAEIFRVLKPGGKLMLFTWDNTINIPLFKLLVNDLMLPHFAGEDTTRLFVPFSIYDTQLLTDMVKNAGFKNIEVRNVALRSGAPSAENVATALFRKHRLGMEVLTKGPEVFEAVAQRFEKEIAARLGDTNPKFELSAFLTTGVK